MRGMPADRRGLGVGQEPPGDARKRQDQHRDSDHGMRAQQRDFRRGIDRVRRAQPGNEHHEDQQRADPVNGDGDGAIAVSLLFHCMTISSICRAVFQAAADGAK
jgi:hypothetical protein